MKKIAWAVSLTVILGVITGIVSLRLTSALEKDAEEVHNEQAFSGEEVRSIDIDTSTADVQIIKGVNNQIQVELFGSNLDLEKYLYQVQLADGVLGIELNKKRRLGFSLDFFNQDSMRVKVTVPDQTFDSLKLQTSSSSVKLHNLKAVSATVESSSGDIQIGGAQINEKLMVRSSSGEITLNHMDGSEAKAEIRTSSGHVRGDDISFVHTEAETSSGDVNLNYRSLHGDIFAHTSSGNVELSFNDEPSSLTIDYDSSSGEELIQLGGIDYEERTEHKVKGQKGKGKYQVKVETSSGDFSIE
ncbi:DUF4097 family beta strand repeat-containing protein [Halobacillus trueperi]|nr:DUF4097 family beta strand repeat-containing protein [Halobacillus trueperi]